MRLQQGTDVLIRVLCVAGRNGKPFLTNANRVVNPVVGGWNVVRMFTADSGLPFYTLAGGDVANTGGGPQRAERKTDATGHALKTREQWLNPNQFTVPTPYRLVMSEEMISRVLAI